MSHSQEDLQLFRAALPPTPWIIPDSACGTCGEPLAVVDGVGRYVIRHVTGEYACPRSLVVSPEDAERARKVMVDIENHALLVSGISGENASKETV